MKKNKTIVIGCGRLGSGIATKLSSEGRNVIIIDKSDSSFRRLGDGFNGYTIVGDATDVDFLKENFILETNTLIITTEDDNTNIFLADIALNIFNVENIIIRLNDPSKEKIIDTDKIKTIFPFKLSFDAFNEIYEDGDKK